MARRKRSKKVTLEIGWDIAMNSVTRKIYYNGTESEVFMESANREFRDIDRDDWWPEAERIFSYRPSISYQNLAEGAAAIVINKKMNVDYLTVHLGGDT
ncbi:hypothetical protein [Parapedobacter soli]|uniref:hypothetical protein n=1 Tax=Parapedobacter soli TaxID=416955 RepID=UPI0021C60EB1|nr:hypothetical protein [Parapedobacter soli]